MARQREPLTIRTDGEVVFLEGAIDERASLGGLVGQDRGGRLVLDLAGITFINSIGVREWCRMQAAAMQARLRVELRRVAELIVNQLNIVVAARGGAIVTSFYAPYICERCDRDDAVLLDVTVSGHDLARKRPPRRECPECGEPMVFGHPPELYFNFLG